MTEAHTELKARIVLLVIVLALFAAGEVLATYHPREPKKEETK
jgi:hypothetical protein